MNEASQSRHPRKFVPKPYPVTTIHYWMQYFPNGQLEVHFRDGTSYESGNTIDDLIADGCVEVFDHLPNEKTSYGAREIDGTRGMIVEDAADWQPFDGTFREGVEYRSRDERRWRLVGFAGSIALLKSSFFTGPPIEFSPNGTWLYAEGPSDWDITHQRADPAPQPAPQGESRSFIEGKTSWQFACEWYDESSIDGCGGELRPHLIELVRKSDYDALQGRCEALTKECDEWKAEAERCGQFELRQVEEREAIKRAVGFEENGPSLPEWCAKIARNLASEEAACSQLIDERDGAQDAADHLASNILGEPIDWSFHAEKWNEAREAALALRTQLAEANKRCDDLRAKLEQAESELNRLRNQLRIEYTRNDALARIRDAVGRIAQVFGDGIYVMPIDSELGSVQMVLNRYKELETRTTAEISEADRVAGKTMIGGGELPPWTADVKEAT